ncbi:MAG: hypothetical protein AAFQ41_06605 [Cyanobacteria bacterium J06623_7]
MTEPFNFPDGRVANNAEDLLQLCEQYPDDATGFLVRQDLEKWLAYIGKYDVAECAANARQIDTGDRQKLEEFLNRCHSLNEPQPVPEAVKEPELKDNLTTPPKSVEPVTEAAPKSTASAVESTSREVSNSTAAPTVVSPTPQTKTSANTKPKATTQTNSDLSDGAEKPSFFQVVAKLIVKILYRDKA